MCEIPHKRAQDMQAPCLYWFIRMLICATLTRKHVFCKQIKKYDGCALLVIILSRNLLFCLDCFNTLYYSYKQYNRCSFHRVYKLSPLPFFSSILYDDKRVFFRYDIKLWLYFGINNNILCNIAFLLMSVQSVALCIFAVVR